MRIVIADDHTLFRESLCSLLTARGFEIVGEAREGGRRSTSRTGCGRRSS